MTQTYYPFDAGNGSDVRESQWAKMARLFCPTGVVKGKLNQLEVFGDASGMNVKVKSGQAFLEGFFFESDAQETLSIATAHGTLARIDRVIARLDRTNNIITLAVLTGTPNASPSAPTLTQTDTLWEISLARVAVGAGVTNISAGNVTDERGYTVDWTSAGIPEIVIKTADENINNTTLQDDNHLFFTLQPGEVRFFDLYLLASCSTAAVDLKCGWSVPSGTTMRWGLAAGNEAVAGFTSIGLPATAQTTFGLSESGTLSVGLGAGSTNINIVHLAGWIFGGANGGAVTFRWAEDTTEALGLTLRQYSFLKHYKIYG